ncbi:MAG: hypothetical protein EOM26_00670 [Alphaproteobacteria bacterium]|nr:hypothetical protein [Alphaproteobacteria bacterium]
MRSSESGNALIYILIGVTLFAALGFAVSQSNRGNNLALTSERSKLAAAEIIEFANTVGAATGQIRLRGFADTAVSFENDFAGGYANANCTDDICKIFHIDGGAVIYKTPPAEWLDTTQTGNPGYGVWVVSGNNTAEQIGDDATPDLILFLPYVRQEICKAINDHLGVTNPSGEPPEEADTIKSYANIFTGAYGNPTPVETLDLPASVRGARAACFEGTTTPPANTYHYFHVLIAR